MKIWMKTSIAAASVAAIGLGASAAVAGGWGDCSGMGGHEMHGAGMHRMHGAKQGMGLTAMSERVDQRLTRLEEALALQPGQRGAWDEFSSTMRGKAAKAAERMESRRNRERPATAVERMERMEELGKERLESMQEMRKAVERLYSSLDDGQKKVFDEQFRKGGSRQRGNGRHGPG